MSITSTCINAKLQGKKVVIFGAGYVCEKAMFRLNECDSICLIDYICDNDSKKQGESIQGKLIHSPSKLLDENKNETAIIITGIDYCKEIARQLFDMGFTDVYSIGVENANKRLTEDDIKQLDATKSKAGVRQLLQRFEVLSGMDPAGTRKLFADDLSVNTFDKLIEAYRAGNENFTHINSKEKLYFNDIFLSSMTNDEVYIDVGVFGATTILDFIFYSAGNYKKIYGFEPNIMRYTIMDRELSDIRDFRLFPYGLFDKDGQLSFDIRDAGASKIVNADETVLGISSKIDVVKLDGFLKEAPTFIKMDIEGAEYNALMGAKETIQAHRPKLAISAYHKDDDLVSLPMLIKELVPEYKLYLRHHSNKVNETVLYAKI